MPSGNAEEAKSKRRRAKLGGGGKGKDTEGGFGRGWLRKMFAKDSKNAPNVKNREGKTGQLAPGRVAGADRNAENKAKKRASAAMGHTPKEAASPKAKASASAPAKPNKPAASVPAASSPARVKTPAPVKRDATGPLPGDKPGLGGMPAPLTPAKTGMSEAAAALGRAGARGKPTLAAVTPTPKRSALTQMDATGSTTGDRWRSRRYSAMDRNK